MKKALKITLLSVLGLVIVAGVLVWMEFGSLIKGANSCVKLDDGLYYMEYCGDDGFDGLMAKGGSEKADGDVLMGRNFDFPSGLAVIMHCVPDKGYETITTFNAEFYGFGEDYKRCADVLPDI